VDKRIAKIEKILCYKQPLLEVFLDEVHSSQNLSAILRSCDGVGVLNLYYASQENHDLRIHKTITQGAHRWVEKQRINQKEKVLFLQAKQAEGFQVIVTHLDDKAVSFREVDYTLPTLLVVGNEKDGVSQEVIALANQTIMIPMCGMVQSLNVSVATATVLYEAQRQLEEVGRYELPQLDKVKRDAIRDAWLYRDVIARRSKGRISI
jgi:tRNA (guanosine-2'-O-)-methyltransferase